MTESAPPSQSLPITTGLEFPGYPVTNTVGLVFGLVVRSIGAVKGFTAGFSALRQGEVTQYTEVLEDARRHAIDRMVANANVMGVQGIVAVRFDSTEVGQSLTEILAYGTGVTFD